MTGLGTAPTALSSSFSRTGRGLCGFRVAISDQRESLSRGGGVDALNRLAGGGEGSRRLRAGSGEAARFVDCVNCVMGWGIGGGGGGCTAGFWPGRR